MSGVHAECAKYEHVCVLQYIVPADVEYFFGSVSVPLVSQMADHVCRKIGLPPRSSQTVRRE